MSKEPTLDEQAKKVFKETVDLYRKDLHAMIRNPWPFILAIAALIAFALLIRWL